MTISDEEIEELGIIEDPKEIIVELKDFKVTKEDIDFVIRTMIKEAKYDEESIKQLFFGMSSAFTKVPMPHVVNSKNAGAGKSYLLNLVADYFPSKNVIVLAGASAKALLHKKGIMVIKNEETGELEEVEPIIDNLEEELQSIESVDKKNQDKHRIKEIEKEIKHLRMDQKKLIDLQNTVIIIQDTPEEGVIINIISLLSQDSKGDQEYIFNDKTASGKIQGTANILRGMPVLFTTRVVDDTRHIRFEEMNRRSINVTPNVSKQKIDSAIDLISKKDTLLPEEYDEQVVSREDKEKARTIIIRVVEKLKNHSKYLEPKQTGIRCLFSESIRHCIPTAEEDVWAMTVTDRLMRYLSIITKVNMDSRARFVNTQTGSFWLIPTYEDLKETLQLMERAGSNIRPYIAQWYNKVFKPAYDSLEEPNYKIISKHDKNGSEYTETITEERIALTSEILKTKTSQILGIPKPSTGEMLKKYLYPLENQGIIDKAQSKIDGRASIYFPADEDRNISSLFANSEDISLEVKDSAFYPSKEAIMQIVQSILIRNIAKSITPDTPPEKNKIYRLVDPDGNELSAQELVDRYLFNPEICFVVRNSNISSDIEEEKN